MIKIKNVSSKVVHISEMHTGSDGRPVASVTPVLPDEVREFDDEIEPSIRVLEKMGMIKVARKAQKEAVAAEEVNPITEEEKPAPKPRNTAKKAAKKEEE